MCKFINGKAIKIRILVMANYLFAASLPIKNAKMCLLVLVNYRSVTVSDSIKGSLRNIFGKTVYFF